MKTQQSSKQFFTAYVMKGHLFQQVGQFFDRIEHTQGIDKITPTVQGCRFTLEYPGCHRETRSKVTETVLFRPNDWWGESMSE